MTQAQMLPIDLQRTNEQRFSRKFIDLYIKEWLNDNDKYKEMVREGVVRVTEWLKNSYYDSKNKRLAQLKSLDLTQLVESLIIGSAYFQRETTFVSATSQLAGVLGFNERREAIQTVAELCAVLCWTGAFTIFKENKHDQMMFQSDLKFPKELEEAINRSMYLPPLVVQPEPLTSNFESPYLTHNDCRILGKKNGHDGNICLDVINRQIQTALTLDTAFLSCVVEEPNHDLDTPLKRKEWEQFKYDSYCVYTLIAKQNNCFFLDYKVDKRGRLYAQGHHISTQGSAFKKAMIELYHQEVIEGVPTDED